MSVDWHSLIPEPMHDPVRHALTAVHGTRSVECLGRVLGGASGAVALHLRSGAHDHLLRVEVFKHPARNPHQYRCMRIAADAGIAPPLHYADADAGVAVMDFVRSVPLGQFPGGSSALLGALGTLARELQETEPFPELRDFRAVAGRLLGLAEQHFSPGLLAGHRAGYDQLCADLAWDSADHVSSHNDPNPRNLLFDGNRLWMIDWETAYRNDPFVDIAILCDNLAVTPTLRDAVLQTWLGRPATAEEVHRLKQVTLLTRIYYAGLLFMVSGPTAEPLRDLDAPTRAEFEARVAQKPPPPAELMTMLAKMHLRGFAEGWAELNGRGPP